MSLTVNYPDKILAGLHQSYTILSDEGAPQGTVTVDGEELPHRVIPLGPPKEAKESTTPLFKFKVTFLLPKESVGKSVVLRFQAGSSSVDDTKSVTES
ncbi:MAG TPA: hypothetical protein VFD71_00290 [Planctomycetota bacterium]|jgi:hypothetical protein|nr:hypothetical protein [Planctomycetota bacterium]